MALRKLVIYPNKPLTQKAEPVKAVGPQVAKLVGDLIEAMEVYDGVGLAAPQVGVPRRVVVLHNPDTDSNLCLINPEVTEGEGRAYGEEGCLSLPQLYAQVPRHTKIRVRALNEHGKPLDFEARDMLARIIQHEVDHLDGILFVDRLDILTREAKMREWAEIRARLSSAVASND